MTHRKAMGASLASGALVGALCAALLLIAPIRDLEGQAGLRWLFNLRGPMQPSERVAVIAMNHRAAANIFLPRDPEAFQRCQDVRIGSAPPTHVALPTMPSRWPRCLHAELVKKLASAGARLIAFDVLFRQRPSLLGTSGDVYAWQDEVLASAIARTPVVIAQRLEFIDGREAFAELSPAIAQAALGSAPFPIVAKHDRRVDRFMAFKEAGQVTPTLPAIAVQAYAIDAYPRLVAFLAPHTSDAALLPATPAELEAKGELQATCLLVRQLFLRNGAIERAEALHERAATAADSAQGDHLRALISLYAGDRTRVLNFYGPAGTIPTLGFDEVLGSTPDALNHLVGGRAIFVGYSEFAQVEEIEHFATAFSTDSGLDLSGVEIAATAFSNLLEDRSIRELPFAYWPLLAFLSGLLSTVVCRSCANTVGLSVMIAALAAYGGASLFLFSRHEIWIPVVMPMLIAAPAGMLAAFTWKYWTARHQREELRRAFTYFVPKELVDKLEINAAGIGDAKEMIECACVATDAANFTPLAETMAPENLADFLHGYFEALFGRVAVHGGFVSDIVGDAMLAIWPHRSADTHARLLHALVEMRDAAQQFNERLAGNQLMTRFGVDWGRVALTTVGAGAHYEYRAVGDTVNTASRVQELNKRLGTRILLTHPAIGDAGSDFLMRDVGHFLLRGKSVPVHVYELLNLRDEAPQEQVDLCARFSQAISAFNGKQHPTAQALFRELQADFPQDGPTAFYLRALEAGPSVHGSALQVD